MSPQIHSFHPFPSQTCSSPLRALVNHSFAPSHTLSGALTAPQDSSDRSPVACWQVGLRMAGHREKIREGKPREGEHHSYKGHPDYRGSPAPNDLVGYIQREEGFYILGQKGVLVLRRLQRPDVCVHWEPPDTMKNVTVRT